MSSLIPHLSFDSGESVQALLAMEEEEALQAAMNALDPEEAALAIGRAPTIEDKSRLVWALDEEARAEVLDRLHPGFVGALIQNNELENRALLGDLTREQFTRLLRYCSPGRAYYWITLATSFEDSRANMLPMLIPVADLATACLTVPEFEDHCRAIGDFNVEDLRLNLEEFKDIAFAIVTVFGADGMLQEFAIADARLRRLLQTILDFDAEYYAALIHAAIEIADYTENHPEERGIISDDPILLNDLLTVEQERARAGLAPEPTERTAERPRAVDIGSVPNLPARLSGELMRAAVETLPAQRQSELSQEMQLLLMQEAAYSGGSFAQADLENVAGRVQSFVQLGLAGLSEGDPEQAARLLAEQRLRTLMESGARQVERLRQVALRLTPWQEVLDTRQAYLLESLTRPDMGTGEDGRPVLRVRRAKHKAAVEAVELEAVHAELETVSAWVTLVRAVGKARILPRMERYPNAAALTRALAVAAVLYRFWDPLLVEPGDLERFGQTYLDHATGRFNEAAYRALAEAIRSLATEKRLEPGPIGEIARLLARAMDELAARCLHGDSEQVGQGKVTSR